MAGGIHHALALGGIGGGIDDDHHHSSLFFAVMFPLPFRPTLVCLFLGIPFATSMNPSSGHDSRLTVMVMVMMGGHTIILGRCCCVRRLGDSGKVF